MLFNGVRINSHSVVEDSVLLPRVDVGRRARLHKTVIAEGCRIPEGLVVGVDHELDRGRFHVSEEGVTLVTPAMLDGL